MGLDTLVSAETAAFTNSAIAHSMIRDDMHLSAGAHVGVMVIPAALALAQREGWSGLNLLKSIVAGYDMAVALGSAVRASGSCNPHFRPSGIIGAFAAAAVGVVADEHIDEAIAASTLGLGVNMAAGLNEWPWAGGIEITTQMGIASRNGVASLDLATAGISSSETVLEGRDGLFKAYGCGAASAGLFQEWLATRAVGTGIMGAKFKPVSGCNFVQTPVSVALRLSTEVSESVQEVEQMLIVTTTAAKTYPGCDSFGPFNKVQQTKMSLQYATSAALMFGCVDEESYRQFDNRILATLVKKCEVVTDAAYDTDLVNGKQPCRIEVSMRGGKRYQESLADVPWLETSSVKKRFHKEASTIFGLETVNNIMMECQDLATSTSCTRLFALLASRR
jgi:2-methylcitrate dehydratase PrpD